MKNLLIAVALALATLAPGSAHAISAAAKYDLNNKMGPVARYHQLGTLIETAESATASALSLASGETIVNTTDDTVDVASDDEAIILQATGFEAKTASLALWADQGDDAADKWKLTSGTNGVFSLINGVTTQLAIDGAGAWTLFDGELMTNASDVITFTFDDAAASVVLNGFEAADAKLTLQADQSDDSGDDWEFKAAASGNALTISNDASGSQVAKLTIAAADGLLTLADSETLSDASDVVTFAFDDAAAEVRLKAFEATDAKLVLQADESDDSGDDWQLSAAASGNAFAISNDTSGSQAAKFSISTAGVVTLTGALTFSDSETLSNASDIVTLAGDDDVGALAIEGFEAKDAYLLLRADQSDDNGDDWKITAAQSGNALTIANDASGSQVAKVTVSASLGNVTGPGTGFIAGFLQELVAATATTITVAQCGDTFYNSGAVAINLPEASAALGCILRFVTLNASNFDVNPDDADQILTQTDAAGDSMRNATVGNSITIQAVSASQWAVIGVNGTWSDIN
jgi:hypothetical protein